MNANDMLRTLAFEMLVQAIVEKPELAPQLLILNADSPERIAVLRDAISEARLIVEGQSG